MSDKDAKRDNDDEDLDERDEADEEETERAEGEEDVEDEEDLDEEEEDEEDAAPAKEPAPIRGAPPPPPPPKAPDEDPTWWLPHAVLGALVLIGVLGFFGAFNSTLGKVLRRSPAGAPVAAESAKPAAAPPGPATSADKPKTPPKPQQPAGPVYGAKHLVVQWKGATRSKQERSKEEALKRTEEALAKLKGGAKFEDVAKEYSDEPGVANTGGNLGRFSRAGFDPKFVDAVEKLKVGEQSGVVESAFGYHIIVRTE